jgi:hypothetical protein
MALADAQDLLWISLSLFGCFHRRFTIHCLIAPGWKLELVLGIFETFFLFFFF